MIRRILAKLMRDGPAVTFMTGLRVINYRLFQPDRDFELVPALMEDRIRTHATLTIVQIGANVGNTGNDQIYDFLKKWCLDCRGPASPNCHAILIEPVRHLYDQLCRNYEGFRGVVCENVAIANQACTRNFYRLREGIDLEKNGLPAFAEELGSFLPEQLDSLWKHDPENHQLREFIKMNTVVDKVACVSIHELVSKHQIEEIDLLQVDTEGYDYEILRTIDFVKLAPSYINYERIHLKKDEAACRRLLTSNGYRLHDHGQDTLARRSSGLSQMERLKEAIYCRWLDLVY